MHFSLACVALLNNPIVSINLLELLQKIITMHAAVNMTLFISKLNIPTNVTRRLYFCSCVYWKFNFQSMIKVELSVDTQQNRFGTNLKINQTSNWGLSSQTVFRTSQKRPNLEPS